MIKSKTKASFFHFIISLLIISITFFILLSVWYPDPFFKTSGIVAILITIIAVDLVLGPALTFVVFQPKKKTLLFDMSIIVVIQLSALVYGVYTVYQAHPLYIVYAIDRFTPIYTNEIETEKIRYEELKKSKITGPTLAYLEKPTDPEEMSRVTMEVLSGKPDLDARAEYYAPFTKFASKVMQNGLTPQQISETPENKQKLEAFITKYGKAANDYAFLPLVGKEKDVLWVWDKNSEQPVGTLDINPWKLPKIGIYSPALY